MHFSICRFDRIIRYKMLRTCTVLGVNFSEHIFLLPFSAPLFIFGLIKQTIQFCLKNNVKNVHPVLGRSSITNRPGLLPKIPSILCLWDVKLLCKRPFYQPCNFILYFISLLLTSPYFCSLLEYSAHFRLLHLHHLLAYRT